MKSVSTILLAVVCAGVVFLSVQTVRLQSSVQALRDAASQSGQTQPQASMNQNTSTVVNEAIRSEPLTDGRLRQIVREELTHALTEIYYDRSLDVVADGSIAEPSMASPDVIQQINDQVEQDLLDGEFSQVEMIQFETSLAQLNKAQRREVLNRFAQTMTRAKIGLIE